MNEFSPTQEKVLRYVALRAPYQGASVQIAGYGRASWTSAANALKRNGLLGCHRTGSYYLTDEGQEQADRILAAFRAARAALKGE